MEKQRIAVNTLSQTYASQIPKRRTSRRQARQHSEQVRIARFVLPIFVVGIIGAYLVFSSPRMVDINFERQFSNLDVATEDLRMENPRFTGEDERGRPYEVVAGAATQDPLNPQLVVLENPEALRSAVMDAGSQVRVTANAGLYRMDDRAIDLSQNVELGQTIGESEFILRTEAATVALDDRTVTSKGEVFGQSADGTLTADSMKAYEEDGRSIFYNAHMVLIPKKQSPKDEDQDSVKSEGATEEAEQDGQPKT